MEQIMGKSMEKSPLMHLHLQTPLVYTKTTDVKQAKDIAVIDDEEFIFCFEVEPAQGCSIEPIKDNLLMSLIFTGKRNVNNTGFIKKTTIENEILLPAGEYLFIQCREALNKEQWLDMAVEQQKDGLWERYKLMNRLYVRYLFEDGKQVTQVLRSICS